MKRFFCFTVSMLLATNLFAAKPDDASLVTTTVVVSNSMQQVLPLSGTTEALRSSGLSPRIDGLVVKLLVKEGEWVEAGQALLELDNAIAVSQLASAQARVDEAQARYEDAKRQREEFQSLRNRQHVAANTLESAKAEENVAKAAVAAQRAELQRLQDLLARHTLKAPFAGLVAEKHTETGQWVKADSLVLRLVELDTIRVRAPLPQLYYQKLARDSVVRISFDALPGKSFSGKLSGIVSVGNQSTRSFPLFIDIDNQQHIIAPGMSAQIFVELKDNDADALLVPRDAVVLRADGSRLVWRVIEDKEGQLKVEPVKVLVGRAQDAQVEILESTLQAGDRIVMLGNESLRPGQAIRVSQIDKD